MRDRSLVQFGSAFMDTSHLPLKKLARHLCSEARCMDPERLAEYLPPGHPGLREWIARRYLESGIEARRDDVVVTSGALEALWLCLGAVARPGDMVAIESPGFYAAFQAIRYRRLKALEVPARPGEGIDMGALAVKRQEVVS